MILPIYVFTLILLKQFDGKFCEKIRKWAVFLIIPVVLVVFCIAVKSIMNNVLNSYEYVAMLIGITSLISLMLIKIKDSKYQHLIFLVSALAILFCGFGSVSMRDVVVCLGF